ncbi:hypothetical protein MiSe_39180 [Microseira wollei NIES-4236]|uniref:Uncharacterized protein n=1 Tax=Microseira wollei NIES-4236 TaxID=2530354 RepID=A0AAV3XAB1_9CYAN|nr:hypothetical protein MiSe_39180 [Microseira wollei NIES-4236]
MVRLRLNGENLLSRVNKLIANFSWQSAIQKPGFYNNTFANFLQRPHAKAWAAPAGTQTLARLTQAEILSQPAFAGFVCIATPLRVSDFDEGIVQETGFLESKKECPSLLMLLLPAII